MFDERGRLLHRYKEGSAQIHAFLEDYAYLIWGLTELYFATLSGRYLAEAKRLTDLALEHFWDEKKLRLFPKPRLW
ncbi:MAG: hypothetical protein Q9N34_06305 [Aquificota bacterium]|nr:hypothetical protein [Aquificota bacterium]